MNKTTKNRNQYCLCPNPDTKLAPSPYKSMELPLHNYRYIITAT